MKNAILAVGVASCSFIAKQHKVGLVKQAHRVDDDETKLALNPLNAREPAINNRPKGNELSTTFILLLDIKSLHYSGRCCPGLPQQWHRLRCMEWMGGRKLNLRAANFLF